MAGAPGAADGPPPLAHLGDAERYYELWKDRDDAAGAPLARLETLSLAL